MALQADTGDDQADSLQQRVEERFMLELRHHLAGLRAKVALDFSKESFEKELKNLKGDDVYPNFGFDRAEYVLIRLMGRMSISIGRRLGEIYDKIPRFVAAARYGLSPGDVAPLVGELELDIALRYELLATPDVASLKRCVAEYFGDVDSRHGVGIEIRYNFNPNDSARLRKDVQMAAELVSEGLLPIYLIFSSISPRDEAIARLQRAGWSFLIGAKAREFAASLLSVDIATILEQEAVQKEIRGEVDALMSSMLSSHAFKAATAPPPH